MKGHRGVLFWALMLATLATRVWIALGDHRALIGNDVWQDDAFYCFQIARNLAHGNGLTFDGITPTSGFQPLWVLLLVPIYWCCGQDPVLPLHVAGLVLAAFSAGTAWSLYGLARLVAGRGVALVALALWAASACFVTYSVNGLETGVATFFAVRVVELWVRDVRGRAELGTRAWLAFGATSALAVLARVDALVLLAALAADAAWAWLFGHGLAGPARGRWLGAAAALAVWLPWGCASRAATGDWLPASGAASRLIAHHYGWPNDPPVWVPPERVAAGPFDPEAVPPAYVAEVATKLAALLVLENPVLGPLRFDVPFGAWPNPEEWAPYRWFRRAPQVGTALGALALAGIAWLLARRRVARAAPDAAEPLASLARVVGAYLVLLVPAYAVLAPAHWYFPRYAMTAIVLTLPVSLAWAARATAGLGPRGAWSRPFRLVAVALVLGVQASHARFWLGLESRGAEADGFLAKWEHLGPRIEPGARVGAFQAGIYGYFSGRPVVNLDGKVNPAAHAALRDKRVHRYVLEQRIDYILDSDRIVWLLCTRHAPKGSLRLELVARDDRPMAVSLYRVRR
jgi:hypothetical protein